METLAAELRSLNRERDLLAAERDRLRVEWVEVNRTVPDIAQTCPTCGQALPAELVQEAQVEAMVGKVKKGRLVLWASTLQVSMALPPPRQKIISAFFTISFCSSSSTASKDASPGNRI